MNIALWTVTSLLAAAFLAGGMLKLTQPKAKVAASLEVFEDFSDGAVKGIGALEVLAAAGLILPAAFDIAPVLVPLAAVGVVLLMIGAMITHARRREIQAVAANVAVLALAVFVVWGRFGPESFTG